MIFNLLEKYIPNLPTKTLKRGEIFYNEGDQPERIYIVLEGMVGLFHISESGKETFLRIFSQGHIFGHRSYLAQTKYHATAMALTTVNVAIINTETWSKITLEEPTLCAQLIKILACDLGLAELRLAGLIDKSATSRIIESLVYLKLKYPQQIWTRKEIAEFSGSTFETVARVMGQLSDLSLIEKKGRDYKILNQQALLQYSSEQT